MVELATFSAKTPFNLEIKIFPILNNFNSFLYCAGLFYKVYTYLNYIYILNF